MSHIKREFQLLREELGARITSLEKRVSALEDEQQRGLPSSDLESVVEKLKNDINEKDQELLSNDVEIGNLPEVDKENPIHSVLLVAAKIGMKLDERDIVSAERIGARRINATDPSSTSGQPPARPRRLVVRLTRRDLRDQLLACARVRRGATTADLGMPGAPTRFYINERLTKINRQLFHQARETGNRLGWKYVWTKRGRILARQKPGESVSIIRNEEDIRRVFGSL
ncbi:uncharacterized protein LOC121729477 [Aricia agestis]|uniref:uncharacterized protein LOC121729477 n=1 Tax=Aricia agestis TaxID=91739 RepID=UPI001C209221|nr:uncharacterized protein LOC121729477 [Aricia agestis]